MASLSATRVLLAAAAAAVLMGSLSGCIGTGGPASSPTPTSAQASPIPAAVPLIPGRVLGREYAAGVWREWIAVKDPLAGYHVARARLLAAGYILTKDRENTTGGDGQACTEKLCVGITGVDDVTYGDSVAYVVYAPSGVGPL